MDGETGFSLTGFVVTGTAELKKKRVVKVSSVETSMNDPVHIHAMKIGKFFFFPS